MAADPAPIALPSGPVSIERVHEILPVVRQSLASRFDACNLSALFDMRHGWGWSSPQAAAGTMYHLYAAEALRTMVREKERVLPEQEAMEILWDVARQRDVPEWERVHVPMREWPKVKMGALKMALDSEFSFDRIVGVEKTLTAEIPYQFPDGHMGTRTFKGTIDALLWDPPDSAIVLDWKLTYGLPPRARVEREEDHPFPESESLQRLSFEGFFQQVGYGLLVLKNFPAVSRVALREVYPLKNEVREAWLYRSQLEDVERRIGLLLENLDRAIAAGPRHAGKGTPRDPWIPMPGKSCSWCLRPGQCPIEPEARGIGAIATDEDAARYAAEFTVATVVRTDRREALKVWCSEHGPIEIRNAKGRSVIGFRPDTGAFGVYTPEGTDITPIPDPNLAAAFEEAAQEIAKTKARRKRERRPVLDRK